MICCSIFGIIYDRESLYPRCEIDITNLSIPDIKSELKKLITNHSWTMDTNSILESIDNEYNRYCKHLIKDTPIKQPVRINIQQTIKKKAKSSNQLSLFD